MDTIERENNSNVAMMGRMNGKKATDLSPFKKNSSMEMGEDTTEKAMSMLQKHESQPKIDFEMDKELYSTINKN